MDRSTKRKVQGLLAALLCWAGGVICFGADGSGDGSPAAIQTWHDLGTTADGDSYFANAGTWSWTEKVTITKGVKLIAAGIGQTIIQDDLPVASEMILLQTTAGKSYEVTGFDAQKGARTTEYKARPSGFVHWKGDSKQIRVHHNRIELHNKSLLVQNAACGLFDYNQVFVNNANTTIWIYHETWGGRTLGHGSWEDPVDWGGTDAVVIENNSFTPSSGVSGVPSVTDLYGGARMIFRANTCTRTNPTSHGTNDGSGRNRGPVQAEVYGNTFHDLGSQVSMRFRGASGVYAYNNLTGTSAKHVSYDYYWGAGKFGPGTFGDLITPSGEAAWSVWDHSDAYGTPGDGIFLAGTASAGSGAQTLVVSGAGWTPDQWVGYTVFAPSVATPFAGLTYWHSAITTNTSDTITVNRNNHYTTVGDYVILEGEAFEIRRLLQGLDHTGSGQSDVYSQSSSNPYIPEDLNQKRRPFYEWGQIGNATSGGGDQVCREDYHYMVEQASPDGSTGMGVGTLAARDAIAPTLEYFGFYVVDTVQPDPAPPWQVGTLYYWEAGGWVEDWRPHSYPNPLNTDESPSSDTDPPTPSPLTFAVNPAAAGPASVTFTATTATDATAPVQYRARYIDQVTLESTQTAWQAPEEFTISGLVSSRQYSFEVQARDAADPRNSGAYSTPVNATTDAVLSAPAASVTGAASAGSVTVGP